MIRNIFDLNFFHFFLKLSKMLRNLPEAILPDNFENLFKIVDPVFCSVRNILKVA